VVLTLDTDFHSKITEYYRGIHPNWVGLKVQQVEDITSGWEAQLIKYTIEHQQLGEAQSRERVIRLYHGAESSGKAELE